MRALHVLTGVLVIVGALNWGLVGAARFDLVAALLGAGSVLSSLVYVAVGAAGAFQAVQLARSAQRREQPQLAA